MNRPRKRQAKVTARSVTPERGKFFFVGVFLLMVFMSYLPYLPYLRVFVFFYRLRRFCSIYVAFRRKSMDFPIALSKWVLPERSTVMRASSQRGVVALADWFVDTVDAGLVAHRSPDQATVREDLFRFEFLQQIFCCFQPHDFPRYAVFGNLKHHHDRHLSDIATL